MFYPAHNYNRPMKEIELEFVLVGILNSKKP